MNIKPADLIKGLAKLSIDWSTIATDADIITASNGLKGAVDTYADLLLVNENGMWIVNNDENNPNTETGRTRGSLYAVTGADDTGTLSVEWRANYPVEADDIYVETSEFGLALNGVDNHVQACFDVLDKAYLVDGSLPINGNVDINPTTVTGIGVDVESTTVTTGTLLQLKGTSGTMTTGAKFLSCMLGGTEQFYIDVFGSLKTPGVIYLNSDSTTAIRLGIGTDARIGYDGNNLVINPKAVGTGYVSVLGSIVATENISQGGNAVLDTSSEIPATSVTTDVTGETVQEALDNRLLNNIVDEGVGLTLIGDNSSVDTAYVPMILYNTDATPPAANSVPIGTLYVQYTP